MSDDRAPRAAQNYGSADRQSNGSASADWRAWVSRRPVVASAGAFAVGALVGYQSAGLLKNGGTASPAGTQRASGAGVGASLAGAFNVFKSTEFFGRLQTEAAKLGNQFADELANIAKNTVVPAVSGKVRALAGDANAQSAPGSNGADRGGQSTTGN